MRIGILVALLFTSFACFSLSLSAQPTLEMRVTAYDQVLEASPFPSTVELDVPPGNGASGWSFGVCSDTSMVTCLDAVLGIDVATLENGGPPGFVSINVEPDGYTMGVVTSLSSPNLPTGVGYEIAVAEYMANPGAPLSTPTTLELCDTLPSGGMAPPVLTVVVLQGASVIPTQVDHELTIETMLFPQFRYSIPAEGVFVDGGTGFATFAVPLQIDQIENGADTAPTSGFSMELRRSDPLAMVTAAEIDLPFEPEFAQVDLGDPDVISLEAVFSTTGGLTLVFSDTTVANVSFETIPGAFIGIGPSQLTMELSWEDDQGAIAAGNSVSLNASPLPPAETIDGLITFNVGSPPAPFQRGDANGDGSIDIADGVRMLGSLFFGEPIGPCPGTFDVNGSGAIDIADPIFLLNHLFAGGPAPAAPYPDCGRVPGTVEASICFISPTC